MGIKKVTDKEIAQYESIESTSEFNFFEKSILDEIEREDRYARIKFLEKLKAYSVGENEHKDIFEEELDEKKKAEQTLEQKVEKTNRGDVDIDAVVEEADEAEEREGDSQEKDGEVFTLAQQSLITMYENTLDRYYEMKEEIMRRQLARGELSVSKEEYNELTVCEMYLRDIDLKFASLEQSHGKHIIELSDSTRKKEEAYIDRIGKYNTLLMEKHNVKVSDIEQLKKELETKAEKIVDLNVRNAVHGESQEYEHEYALLISSYLETLNKIRAYEPSINSMLRDEDEKRKEILASNRNIGAGYMASKEKVTNLGSEERAQKIANDLGVGDRVVTERDASVVKSTNDREGELTDSTEDIHTANREVIMSRKIEDRFGGDPYKSAVDRSGLGLSGRQEDIVIFDNEQEREAREQNEREEVENRETTEEVREGERDIFSEHDPSNKVGY